MIATNEWFQRKFENDLALEMFPNVLARLRGTPARIEDLLRDVERVVLIRRDEDKWSMQEQVGHLWDLESLWAARLDDYEAGATELHVADLQNRRTHEADHNAHDLAALLAAFRAERMAIMARLEGYDEAFIARTALHPRLRTPMRVIDLCFFVAEHDDHHLARMAEMKQISPGLWS
jgi:hypothetical protein